MIRLAVIASLLASSALAQTIDLSSGGTPSRVETSPAGSLRLPTEAWTPDGVVSVREGAFRRSAYQFPSSTRTTLQLIEPARTLLEEEGYTTVFECADAACGGFDFRFQLDLLPEPDMHVDLGNYRYLLMENDNATPHTVSLVASSSATAGFLHVTEMTDAVFPETAQDTPQATAVQPAPTGDFIAELLATGRTVLSDLDFQTGSADLGAGPYASLSTLATWLAANPTAQVVLVGHTDAVGSLDANTSLSQRRAAAVAARLVDAFGTDGTQLQSAGAGFLAPIASNLTAEGRAANRRVEVVLLSLE